MATLQHRSEPLVARLDPHWQWAVSTTQEAWARYRAYVTEREVMQVDRQFFPAVIELQETPPSPTARLLLKAVCGLVGIALLWSIIGKIDIIAAGEGKTVPNGRVKVVQPLEAGIIRKLLVEDGQRVRKGDVLVELDVTQTGADRERLTEEGQVLDADIRRINALLKGGPLPVLTDIPAAIHTMQQELYTQTKGKHAAEMEALNQELAQHRSEASDAADQVKRLETATSLLKSRSDRLARLVKEGFYARNRYDLDETERSRMMRELEGMRARGVQAAAAVTATEEKLKATQAEFERALLSELAEKEQRKLVVTKELAKAEERNRQQTLVAPIDGTVQELKVHTLGGVVTPAQELMKVVPFEDALEAEVLIANKDIGFVKEGQSVAIKLEAFPYTKYGLLHGHVKSLSLDAINDEKLGLVYRARIAMDEAVVNVGEKTVVLTSGLTLAAEIKTGTRRIIEYFLSPLMEYAHESIQER